MKLLKIGRSPSCNIILHSDKVSALHAEMILLDNGEILLEDKNSTNGTFVSNRKITPNTEVTVLKGDCIRFADVELSWAHIPAPENNSKYKKIVNIGTNFHNDIVITGTFASRFHATFKVSNDRKAFIKDLDSKNGTKVNGVKIQPGKDIRIKKGDIVLCGDVDVTDQIAPLIPDPLDWVKKVAIVAGVAAAFVAVVFVIFTFMSVKPDKYRPAVVYVRACYHYVVTFDDNPIPELWEGKLTFKSPKPYQATAFFIDKEGRMATNRHVAIPWEYRTDTENNMIRQEVEEFLNSQIPIKEAKTEDDLNALVTTNFGKDILQYSYETSKGKRRETITKLNTIISRLKKSKITVTGEMDYITVGYPGRNYTHTDEFERCDALKESGTDDKDIALLQLNIKKTPKDIKYFFDVKNFKTDKLEPLQDKLYTIGYPNGIMWGMDKTTKSLEPAIRETMCSKLPSKYTFEFQGESVGGASGSPIFNKRGQLVGVLWGRWLSGTTFGQACQAKFLKEMYEEEVGL